ncbi:hypothetical protein RchiOBHm_Chr2g0159301 [Rosa chinensis]|uniref:Uncharacterized protein n=1 Tax=Rosa chinensis TaxID=74649 RepID=A0A2P6S277_ROSCH|nr:hypothetical protein RchiOBHm_Chr2g0159301 [Rosa chinensis]
MRAALLFLNPSPLRLDDLFPAINNRFLCQPWFWLSHSSIRAVVWVPTQHQGNTEEPGCHMKIALPDLETLAFSGDEWNMIDQLQTKALLVNLILISSGEWCRGMGGRTGGRLLEDGAASRHSKGWRNASRRGLNGASDTTSQLQSSSPIGLTCFLWVGSRPQGLILDLKESGLAFWGWFISKFFFLGLFYCVIVLP